MRFVILCLYSISVLLDNFQNINGYESCESKKEVGENDYCEISKGAESNDCNDAISQPITTSNKLASSKRLQLVKDNVRSYPDFPKPGVLFRDIFGVMHNPEAFRALLSLMEDYTKSISDIDVIVGLDSRGFLLAPHLALSINVPFVPIRKKGKLPGPVHSYEYSLEYGKDIVEIQKESIKPGQNVLIVDDLIATGGTLNASCQLVEQLGANVKQCLAALELVDLRGRDKIKYPVHAIIVY